MPQGVDSVSKSFSQLLEEYSTIAVPPYQRRFSWKTEKINQLWDDMMSLLQENEEDRVLFLGPIVLHIEDGQAYLVDGQQRVVTLSLVAASIKHHIRLLTASDEAEALRRARHLANVERLLYRGGTVGRGPRLKLSSHDNDAFQEIVNSGQADAAPRPLRAAWNRVKVLVEGSLQAADSSEITDRIIGILSNAAVFATVRVSDPCDPLSVFESLNSKGQPLVQSDLIKNRVLQQMAPARRSQMEARWDSMVASLPEGEVTHYLRAWWIAQRDFVSGRKLYSKVRAEVRSPTAAQQFLRDWHDHATFYSWISQGRPAHGVPELRAALLEFQATGFVQGRPILLALFLRGQRDLVPNAVHELARIYVRVIKTAQQRGSIFEGRIDAICAAIRNDPRSGLEELRRVADSLIGNVGAMNWQSLHVDDGTFARYLLTKIAQLPSQDGPTYSAGLNIEVEHVLPQVPATEISDDQALEDYQYLTSHIGNQTLVLDLDNPRCGNRAFAEKRDVYREYRPTGTKQPTMTGRLASEPDWDESKIIERARWLAGLAEEVWPVASASSSRRRELAT